MSVPADGNVSVLLDEGQRENLRRLVQGVAGPGRGEFVLLADRSGRIVDAASSNHGVRLLDIASLAAACFATTHGLAAEIGERTLALRFLSDDDQQIVVRPLTDRALLVAAAQRAPDMEALLLRLDGPQGRKIAEVLAGAGSPDAPRAPRFRPQPIPAPLRRQARALGRFILDLQTQRPGEVTPAVRSMLLTSRNALAQSLHGERWNEAAQTCERITEELIAEFRLPARRDPGGALTELYGELLAHLLRRLAGSLHGDRRAAFLTAQIAAVHRQWPALEPGVVLHRERGLDLPAAWHALHGRRLDALETAEEFIPAMDTLVRTLLRALFVTRGPHAAQEALMALAAIKETHRPALLPHGLDTEIGDGWTDLTAG